MDLPCNLAKAGFFALVTREKYIDDCIFVRQMNLITETTNFDRRNPLEQDFWVLSQDKFPIKKGHATAGIKADQVVFAGWSRPDTNLQIVRSSEGETGTGYGRSIGNNNPRVVWRVGDDDS